MQLSYLPQLEEGIVQLDEKESIHYIRVLRYVKGDKIHVFDGNGFYAEAVVVDDNPKACCVQVKTIKKAAKTRPYHLHLAISPLKHPDRFEWLIEKASEIGVDEITPLLCERTEKKNLKMERLENLIISASKQSLNYFMPKLNVALSFSEFVKQSAADVKCIAICENIEKKKLSEVLSVNQQVIIMIGPEGDFTPKELQLAQNNNYASITLGNRRLRTETAGIVACEQVFCLLA
jgi:16S rRNA (uracil1498-N3)-methyltransferase